MRKNPYHVLIVDDEPLVVRALDRLLKPIYRTHCAESGKAALEIVRSQRIDVIVSDQRMPEMTGVELLERARLISPNTTRILLTGYSDLSAVVASVNEAEIFRYVTKPWRAVELLATVKKASEVADALFEQDAGGSGFQEAWNAASAKTEVRRNVLVVDKERDLSDVLPLMVGVGFEWFATEQIKEASNLLGVENIHVIIMNASLGDTEALAFIKMVKVAKPNILCLVVADSADIEHLMGLINEGQIYRFLKKPIRTGQLRMYLNSAVRYCNQLIDHPELLARHAVDRISSEEERGIAQAFRASWNSLVQAFRRLATP